MEMTEQTASETPTDPPMDDTEEGEILEDGEIAEDDDESVPTTDTQTNKKSDHKSSDNEKENNREKSESINCNNRDRDSRRRDTKSEDKSKDRADRTRDRDRDKDKDRRHDRSDRTDRSSRERKSSESDTRDRDRDRKSSAASNTADDERRRRERDRKRRRSDDEDKDERQRGQGDDKRKRRSGDSNWSSDYNNDTINNNNNNINSNANISRNPFNDFERRPFDDFDFRQPPDPQHPQHPQQQPFPLNAGPPHHNNNADDDLDFDERDFDEMLAIMGSQSTNSRPIDSVEKRNMMRAMAEMMRRNLDPDKGRRLARIRDKRRANDRMPGPTGTRAPGRGPNDRPERQPQYKQICKFFLEGKCHKGPDCQFSHEAMPPKKKDLCKFYLQGFCGKGEDCLFMHSDFPCKFFHTNVECYSGDKCRFSHQPLTEDTREILRNYLDSGQLPDDPKPDRQKRGGGGGDDKTRGGDKGSKESQNQANSQTNSDNTENNETLASGGDPSASTYAPIKPVAKRHALLGDATKEIKCSHPTWVWQQEMKELEVAYVGNKRNLFCIEKEFAMTEKPATPRMEDDEEEIEEQIRNYYKDTMPDFDDQPIADIDLRTRPEAPPMPAMAVTAAPLCDEQKLIEASFHDEDLRTLPPLRPRSHTNESMDRMNSNQIAMKEEPSPMDVDQRSQHLLSATEPTMSPMSAEVPQNVPKLARDLLQRMQNKLQNDSGNKTPDWMSDSDEDEDGVMAAALKNVQQSAQDKSKGNIDISKMLSSIRNSSSNAAPTVTQSPKQSEFWQNLMTSITGTSPSGNSTPPRTEYRDPRLKRLVSPQIDSTPAVKICDPNVKIEYKLWPMKAPDIDYSTYVSIYRIDARLKNDPRLQKYFSKLESSGLESLSRIVPPPLKTPPVTPISFLMNKKRSEKEKSNLTAHTVTIKAEPSDLRPESPSLLPPLPPLTISPSKSAPMAGIIPPSPPPIMSPLELISSRPTFTVSPGTDPLSAAIGVTSAAISKNPSNIESSIDNTLTTSAVTIRRADVNDRFDAIYALNADQQLGV